MIIEKKIYCDDDGEYRIYCHICDRLAVDGYYSNHFKSQTNIFRRNQQLNFTNKTTSS